MSLNLSTANSRMQEDREKRTLLVSEHYKFMRDFVNTLQSTATLVSSLKKKADVKGLENIGTHLDSALSNLYAAYGTISQTFTSASKPLKQMIKEGERY